MWGNFSYQREDEILDVNEVQMRFPCSVPAFFWLTLDSYTHRVDASISTKCKVSALRPELSPRYQNLHLWGEARELCARTKGVTLIGER